VANRVDANGPGARAGIKAGDRLLAVDGRPSTTVSSVIARLYQVGEWHNVTFSVQRGRYQFDEVASLHAAQRPSNDWLRLIGLIYLGIGLYVLFRRWTAPGSTHFYVFCLVSFAFCSFHFTGKLNSFDRTIYWGNILANMLQPALLLHFVLTFPEKHVA